MFTTMQTMSIVTRLEKFILDALNHRYNTQVKSSTFLLEFQKPVHKIENRDGSISIGLAPDASWQKFVFRFPQTRIFYTLYQGLHGRIRFIDYFNVHVLILEGEQSQVELVNRSRLKTVSLNRQQELESPVHLNLNQGESLAFLIAPKRFQKKFKSVLHLLQEIREFEYHLNPVSNIRTENIALLESIDDHFAKIELFASFGQLKIGSLQSPFFIYYLQLYLQSGHFDLLLQLLKRIFRNEKTRSQFLKNPLHGLFVDKLKKALQISQQKIPAWLRQIEAAKANASRDLWELAFLQEFGPQAGSLLEQIQQLWESLTVPALEIYWRKKVQKNPAPFLAFLLLGVQNQFYWADLAFRKIKSWLGEQHLPLFELMFHLQRFCYQTINNGLGFGTGKMLAHHQTFSSGNFVLDYHRFGKKIHSGFVDSVKQISLKIDQFVRWELNSEKNELIILPVLVAPPLALPGFNFSRISVGNLQISLPLIWQQFTLQVNGLRFKWIRKKKRFQLSVKVPRQFRENIFVNDTLIRAENVYAKYYFPIKPGKSQWFVSLMDTSGVRVQKIHSQNERLILKGFSLDFQGLLRHVFNFKKETSHRNHTVEGLSVQEHLLPVTRLPVKFQLTARRCDPFVGQIEEVDSFLKSFLLKPGSRLVHQLLVWVFGKEDLSNIKEIFLTRLGFIPQMVVTSEKMFNPTSETLNLLISLNAVEGDELLIDGGTIRVYKSRKGKKVKYLWINRNTVKEDLTRLYFMQKIEKI